MSWKPFTRTKDTPILPAVNGEQVAARASALQRAIAAGGRNLPAENVAQANALLQRVGERTKLGAGHTVVALAGATGSGKSSLFNLLVGEPVSRIGARRPTTSRASAAIWGSDGASALLDWLGVASRHQVHPGMPRYAELDGLVLLDLPDFDSRVSAHREEADRVLEMCDVFVWVTDPQKYADGVLHDEYVKQAARSAAPSVVVLNQVDRLTPEAAQSCRDDLARLLVADGLNDVEVVMTSTIAPGGGNALIEALVSVVQAHNAADARLSGDLRRHATELNSFVGRPAADRLQGVDAELVTALGDAAGKDVVLDAVERDYLRESTKRTGWPFTRWAANVKPRPLARLGLDHDAETEVAHRDARAALGKSSLPPASPAARAAVELATRRVASQASEGLPASWQNDVHDVSSSDEAQISDALDQAVLGVRLRDKAPAWWGFVAVLQWICAAVALVGAAWLLALFVLGIVQLTPAVPKLGGWLPWPLLLLVVGLLLGFLLAVLCRSLAGRGAKRNRDRVEAQLNEAIEGVAQREILSPVRTVLDRHDQTARALAEASE